MVDKQFKRIMESLINEKGERICQWCGKTIPQAWLDKYVIAQTCNYEEELKLREAFRKGYKTELSERTERRVKEIKNGRR